LLPGVGRDASDRRVYDERHVGWLDLMDRLRRTGMSIAEMREYTKLVKLGKTTLEERRALIPSHRDRVRATIAELTRAIEILDGKIDFYSEWRATGKRPQPRDTNAS
jgi:DNA-binding transcriptional MerR regulator